MMRKAAPCDDATATGHHFHLFIYLSPHRIMSCGEWINQTSGEQID